MKNLLLSLAAILPLLGGQPDSSKVEPAVQPSSGMSKELGEAILSELHQIRTLLEKQQSPAQAVPRADTTLDSPARALGPR